MKKQPKRLGLSKTTLSRLSLGQVSGGTGTFETFGCASVMTECNTIDIACNSKDKCWSNNCVGGGSGGYKPPYPRMM